MWQVRLFTKRGITLASFSFDSFDGAHSFFLDMKMTGCFAKPACFLSIFDPDNACKVSYPITSFFPS